MNLVIFMISAITTLSRCRLLHSKRCRYLARRFDNFCRYQELLTFLVTPARLIGLSALRLCASSGFDPVDISVARFVFPALCRASAIVEILHSIALRLLFVTSLHAEYHWELTDARVRTFYFSDFAAWFSSVSGFRSVSLPIHFFQSFCPMHLAVRLFFISLRSICPGCFMPFDSFMYSGFQIGFCKLLLRVINFSFSGFSTSLLLRSSATSPGPVTMISSGELKLQHFVPLCQVFLKKSPDNHYT